MKGQGPATIKYYKACSQASDCVPGVHRLTTYGYCVYLSKRLITSLHRRGHTRSMMLSEFSFVNYANTQTKQLIHAPSRCADWFPNQGYTLVTGCCSLDPACQTRHGNRVHNPPINSKSGLMESVTHVHFANLRLRVTHPFSPRRCPGRIRATERSV